MQKILSYEERRAQIKNGDVLLYKGRGIISWLIQKISHSPYSHVGIAAWWNDRLMVLEAVGKGVIATPLSFNLEQYHGDVHYYWSKIEIADEKRISMVQFAQEQLGKRYNHLEVIVSGIRAALGFSMKDKQGHLFHPAGTYFCSQYVSDIFEIAGIDLDIDLSSERTSPDAIANSPCLKFKGILKTEPI